MMLVRGTIDAEIAVRDKNYRQIGYKFEPRDFQAEFCPGRRRTIFMESEMLQIDAPDLVFVWIGLENDYEWVSVSSARTHPIHLFKQFVFCPGLRGYPSCPNIFYPGTTCLGVDDKLVRENGVGNVFWGTSFSKVLEEPFSSSRFILRPHDNIIKCVRELEKATGRKLIDWED